MEDFIKFLNPFYYLGLFFKSLETPLTSEKLSEEPLKVVVEKPVSVMKPKTTPSKSKKKVKKSK